MNNMQIRQGRRSPYLACGCPEMNSTASEIVAILSASACASDWLEHGVATSCTDIWYFNRKLFLDSHDHLNDVQRVQAEVLKG